MFMFIATAGGVCLLGRNYYQKYLEDYEMQAAQGMQLLDENRLERAYMNKFLEEHPDLDPLKPR